MVKLILYGTAEELASSRAQKVLVSADFAGLDIITQACSIESLQALSPLAKSLVLVIKSSKNPSSFPPMASCHTMMRTIAKLAPTCGLLGPNPLDEAMVDSWLSFIWSSIELPLFVLSSNNRGSHQDVASAQVLHAWDAALDKLEAYLSQPNRNFMVGESITLADIALCVTLSHGGKTDAISSRSNLHCWYERLCGELGVNDEKR